MSVVSLLPSAFSLRARPGLTQLLGSFSVSALDLVFPQAAKPTPLGAVGPDDPAAILPRQLPGMDPTRPAPAMHHDRSDSQFPRQFGKPPFARTRQVRC